MEDRPPLEFLGAIGGAVGTIAAPADRPRSRVAVRRAARPARSAKAGRGHQGRDLPRGCGLPPCNPGGGPPLRIPPSETAPLPIRMSGPVRNLPARPSPCPPFSRASAPLPFCLSPPASCRRPASRRRSFFSATGRPPGASSRSRTGRLSFESPRRAWPGPSAARSARSRESATVADLGETLLLAAALLSLSALRRAQRRRRAEA